MKLVILLTLLCRLAAQDLDNVFDGIKPEDSGSPKDCECVPYFSCSKGDKNQNGVALIDISNTHGTCHYLDVCCKATDKKEDSVKPSHEKSEGCGIRNPEGVGFQITGDKKQEAQFGEFPWIVAVFSKEEYQCGGSLIHPQVVLTVPHWVNGKDKQFKVRAGEWDTQTKNEPFPYQERDVESVKVHPEFKSGTLENNVALLFLSAPFDIAENVNVVCLPQPLKDVEPGTRCFRSGWGEDAFKERENGQDIIKKVDVPIVEREDCQARLRKTRLGQSFKVHDTFLCAGGEPDKEACKGNGGSPLVCPVPDHPGKYEQHGIATQQIGCGLGNAPGVYSAVSKAVNWIVEELKSHNYDKP